MSANSPIRSVPQQAAEPNYFIQRFLRSVQPYYHSHVQWGQQYFRRSRLAGDVLLKEDWDLAVQYSPVLRSTALPQSHQVDPTALPPTSSLFGSQPATTRQHSPSPGLSPADDSSGRGKHSRPRTGNALRTAPYARRPTKDTASPAYYSHHLHPGPSSESANGQSELREHRMHAGGGQERRIVSTDDNVHIALLKQQYNERRRRSSEEQELLLAPVTAPEVVEKRTRTSRPPDLDIGLRNTKTYPVQAEAGRLTLHPMTPPHADVQHPRGIFLRGVVSHPVNVSQYPVVPDANARADTTGFDQLRFLGVNEEPRLQHLQQEQQQQYPYYPPMDKPQPHLSMHRASPSDTQLPPLHNLNTSDSAGSPRYHEAAYQTHVSREKYTTPPLDGGAYASYPSYEDSGRAETTPSLLTVTPEKSNIIWGPPYPAPSRQPQFTQLQLQRQQQPAQQSTPKAQTPYHQNPAYVAYDYPTSYLGPQWASSAYPVDTYHRNGHDDNRAISADPRRYCDNLHRSWDRPVSAPPPLVHETSHLLGTMRGEPTAFRPRPTQWPSAPDVQGSQGSPPRDPPRPQWAPVGVDPSQPTVGGSDWPEPITVPGSTPTWDPSPTSSHFQIPYTPQPFPSSLYLPPTATNVMPTMIEKQAPPVDMYHTTPTTIY